MTIYNGGSKNENKDELLKSITQNSDLSIPTAGNQIFIEYTSDGGSMKNFSATIKFGICLDQNYKLCYSLYSNFTEKENLCSFFHFSFQATLNFVFLEMKKKKTVWVMILRNTLPLNPSENFFDHITIH